MKLLLGSDCYGCLYFWRRRWQFNGLRLDLVCCIVNILVALDKFCSACRQSAPCYVLLSQDVNKRFLPCGLFRNRAFQLTVKNISLCIYLWTTFLERFTVVNFFAKLFNRIIEKFICLTFNVVKLFTTGNRISCETIVVLEWVLSVDIAFFFSDIFMYRSMRKFLHLS